MTVLATISVIIAVCFAGIVGIIVSGLVRQINAKSDQRAHGGSVMDDEVLERLAQIER
jgi:formate hydrogenlyase subunit 4